MNGGSNGEASADAYGENGSFHSANLEIEYQKRLVVSIIFRTLGKAMSKRLLLYSANKFKPLYDVNFSVISGACEIISQPRSSFLDGCV